MKKLFMLAMLSASLFAFGCQPTDEAGTTDTTSTPAETSTDDATDIGADMDTVEEEPVDGAAE